MVGEDGRISSHYKKEQNWTAIMYIQNYAWVSKRNENEECESLNSNSSNKCDHSAEDFRGFCDQKKLYSVLHFFEYVRGAIMFFGILIFFLGNGSR